MNLKKRRRKQKKENRLNNKNAKKTNKKKKKHYTACSANDFYAKIKVQFNFVSIFSLVDQFQIEFFLNRVKKVKNKQNKIKKNK